MKINTFSLAICFVVLINVSLWGAHCELPINGSEPRLRDYIAIATRNNSQLKAAYETWQSSLAAIESSDTLPDPKLSYGVFINEVETRVGPQKQRVGLSQMIPWFGKLRLRKGVAVQSAVVAKEQFCLEYVSVVKRLRKAFYEYYYLDKMLQITKSNIQLLELVERVAQSQVRVGGSIADVLQAQMEISKLKDLLETTRERLIIIKSKINSILNRDIHSIVTIPEDLFSLNVPEGVSKLDLEHSNPTLRILCAQVHKYEQTRKLTYQNKYPDVTLGVDWIQTDPALTTTPDNGKDPIIAKFSVNIPLWQSTYRSRERAATLQKRSSENQLVQQSFQVQSELEDVLLRYKEMDREISLYNDILIPQAKQTLSILQESYESGKSDFDRYLGAQRVMLDFELKLEKARSEKAAIVADYDFLLGKTG